jgi:hypothetical protein
MSRKTNSPILSDAPMHTNDIIVCANLINTLNADKTSQNLGASSYLIRQSVNRIEKRINKDLFIFSRDEKGKVIICEGVEQEIDRILKLAENLHVFEGLPSSLSNLDKQKNEIKGRMVLSSTQTILEGFFLKKINEFMTEYPDIQLSIYQKDTFSNPDQEFEEIFICPLEKNTYKYEYIPFHSFSQKIWASKEYLGKYPPIKTLRDLENHRVLYIKNEQLHSKDFGPIVTQSKLPFLVNNLEIIDTRGCRTMDVLAESSVGLMLSSEETVRLTNLNLVNVLPDYVGETMDMFIRVNKKFLEQIRCRLLVDWMLKMKDDGLRKINRRSVTAASVNETIYK